MFSKLRLGFSYFSVYKCPKTSLNWPKGRAKIVHVGVPPNTWHSMGNDGNEDLIYVTAHPAVDVSREMKEA